MAKRHFLAGYHIKTTGSNPEPDEVLNDLGEFARVSMARPPACLPLAQRVLKVESFSGKGLTAQAVLITGEYGIKCKMIDIDTGDKTHDRQENEADLLPLHVVMDFSVSVPGPLAVFHRFGRQGARTSFEIQFNEYLSTANKDYKVQFRPVAPSVVVKEWLKRGRATHFIFHKRQIGVSKVGQLAVIQGRLDPQPGGRRRRKLPPVAIDRTLTIQVRWGHWAKEKLRAVLGKPDVDPRSLAELVGAEDFEPSSVDIVFDTDEKRTKKYTIGAKFRMAEDIDDQVTRSAKQSIVSKQVFDASRKYILRLSS